MAHRFESGLFVQDKDFQSPWHGLGNIVAEGSRLSVHEALVGAGMNWDVYTRPAGYMKEGVFVTPTQTVEIDGVEVTRPTNNFACRLMPTEDGGMREDVLGNVGSEYTPVQNSEIFGWFQPYLDTESAWIHTAGSLDGGRKVWCLARLNRPNATILPGDEIEKFLMLASSHDMSLSLRVGFTPIRVVCWNTLSAAVKAKGSNLLKLKHTREVLTNLEKVKEIINTVDATFEATAEQYRYLCRKGIDRKTLDEYVKVLFGKETVDKDEDGNPKVSTRQKNILEGITKLMDDQRNSLPGMVGTWWAAYNAVTEHLSWFAGGDAGKKTTPEVKRSNRLTSLWFKGGQKKNDEAFALALKMAG